MYDPAASVSGRGAIAEQPLALKPVPPGLGRRVVVTGAAGFVGCHACRALAGKGWQVRALVRSAAKAAERLAHLPVEIRIGDIRDPAYLTSSMDGATAVVHLAAIESASNARVRRFVHMSQNGSDSKSPYRFLRSKGIAQDLVTASDLEWTVLRPSVIFGREDEFVNMLARLVRLTPFVLPLPDDGRARFQPIAV